MNVKQLTPKLSLNKAFLRLKPTRLEIDRFKTHLTWLLDQVTEAESEEFHKNLLADFLKNTYYAPNHFINTKGRNDLVIHGGKEAKSAVEVIMEVKRPNNRAEMLRTDNLNVKAMHELMLYYLRERLTGKNLALKYLIVTNVYEWFIFDAAVFEQTFAQDKALVKQFTDFEAGRLSGTNTDFFYREIAQPALANLTMEVAFTHVDLRQYEQPLRSEAKDDDKALIALFKLFSPEHLLKLPFANDSNTLDRGFYNELLHIIGLTEMKDSNKKLIQRKPTGERDMGSLLENVMSQLDDLGKIGRLPQQQWGATYQERLFNVGLELVLTWVNRILFLKLLEGQLITYHQGDSRYSFLNITLLPSYSQVNNLFFQVLARQPDERHQGVRTLFAKVPYLNSSLFEPTELEQITLFISNLTSDATLPLLATTVLKDSTGKGKTGTMNTLAYLFEFLNAYDFGSEGAGEIQEENKPLINAAVLGLIFEKINGYKDGSFFTPGFITMYICRETIQRAVIQKFNEQKGWNCQNIEALHNKIEDIGEANQIINSLKICDPAVGSGHFLVSALNEIIALKQQLRILQDRQGLRLRGYWLEVANDELIVVAENGEVFQYNPKNKESQRIQETLFHEKQILIENCLFGVDINSNSVNICRLRLWIELLKHAYYKADGQLETLPNIDINIKVGNSLVSRFALDADLRQVLRGSQWSIESYKKAVQTYQQSTKREEKWALEQLMTNIKNDFRIEIDSHDSRMKQLQKLKADLVTLNHQKSLFAETFKEKKVREQKQTELELEINKLNAEIETAQQDPVYRHAFEWRFEFPQVLNDEGDFVGFDVIIGNPPYGVKLNQAHQAALMNMYDFGTTETAILFIKRGYTLLKAQGDQSFIIPKSYSYASNYARIRQETLHELQSLADCGKVWQDVKLEVCIFHLVKNQSTLAYRSLKRFDKVMAQLGEINKNLCMEFDFFLNGLTVAEIDLGQKIKHAGISLNELATNHRGGMFQKYVGHQGDLEVIGGAELARYVLKDKPKEWVKQNNLSDAKWRVAENSVLVQNIVAHIENPIDHVKIISAIVDNHDKLAILDTVNQLILLNGLSHKYLVALLNSKLINWYTYRFVFGKAIRTMHFDSNTTAKIFLPNSIQETLLLNIETNVSQIFVIKQQDPAADTTALEQEIDQLVYALYGLTTAEIDLVEAALP